MFFPAETQLTEGYAAANNMHKHADKNADPTEVGYLEDNRRIKAIKLGGHRSDAIFMPLKSLAYTGIDVTRLREGDTFDYLGEHEICRKYEIVQPKQASTEGNQAPKPRRVMEPHFPLQVDTSNYWRKAHPRGKLARRVRRGSLRSRCPEGSFGVVMDSRASTGRSARRQAGYDSGWADPVGSARPTCSSVVAAENIDPSQSPIVGFWPLRNRVDRVRGG
ncbi:hypothetical protein [Nocardia sp. NPDC049707]|uniref:hypothetical protein n=1 Tax=Nocardia sp. NPDC049707 TaxID=3154735 RepID=UPI0034332B26